MKNKIDLLLKLSLFFFAFVVFITTNPIEIFGQKKCSTKGEIQKFAIHNTTSNSIQIKVVSNDDCKEDGGKLLRAGDKVSGSSYEGTVFRIYDIASGKLISEIVLNKSQIAYTITEPKTEIAEKDKINPADGFLKTTNKIRADKNLPAMQLDNKLNNACQWLAKISAEVDKGFPVHKVSELGKKVKKKYRKRNKAKQRLVYYGWGKKNTAYFEVVALDTVSNYNLIGDNFANIWAFSTTHYKPFFDKDRVKYNRVGFGVAKAERGKNRYYACAIFGKL